MSETEKKARQPMTRAYILDTGIIEFRASGGVVDSINVDNMDSQVLVRAAQEGVIGAYFRGANVTDIMNGATFSDRSPPKVKSASGAVRKPGVKGETLRVRAIAAVRMSSDKSIDYAHALVWAKDLTPEQLTVLSRNPVVRLEIDKLRGRLVSLDDLLKSIEPDVHRGHDMEEAAD